MNQKLILLLAFAGFTIGDSLSLNNFTAVSSIAAGNSQFSFQLLDSIKSPAKTDNLVLSPLSLSIAMAMLDAGAGGATSSDIRAALHFPSGEDQLHQGYRQLLKEVTEVPAQFDNDKAGLSMPSKIFVAERFTPNPKFSQTLLSNYGADAQRVDYNKPDEAAGTINKFVSTATKDKIQNLINPKSLTPDTVLVLVNAIHFKAPWESTFESRDTTKKPFFTSLTKSVPVDMMKQNSLHTFYGEHPELDAKSIIMQYTALRHFGQMSMLILLPNEKDGLAKLEESLKNVSLTQVLGEQTTKRVNLELPKFKIESTLNLKEPLIHLGCGSIFSHTSNFSGISSGSGLSVSDVVQKAFLEVDENGSEAAAATAILMTDKSGGIWYRERPVPFVVDRPFLAIILMKVSGSEPFVLRTSTPTPVFIARVQNPSE